MFSLFELKDVMLVWLDRQNEKKMNPWRCGRWAGRLMEQLYVVMIAETQIMKFSWQIGCLQKVSGKENRNVSLLYSNKLSCEDTLICPQQILKFLILVEHKISVYPSILFHVDFLGCYHPRFSILLYMEFLVCNQSKLGD